MTVPNLDEEDLLTLIHAKWLVTPRDDLRGQSPREVLLAKRESIDFDLHSRELQWSRGGHVGARIRRIDLVDPLPEADASQFLNAYPQAARIGRVVAAESKPVRIL